MLRTTVFLIIFTCITGFAGAQSVASANARVSAHVINAVGTGSIQSLETTDERLSMLIYEIDHNGPLIHGRNRLLVKEAGDPRIIQILSNGNIYDITINYNPIIRDNEREIRIQSIRPVPVSRTRFFLSAKMDIDQDQMNDQRSFRIPCDILIHFN